MRRGEGSDIASSRPYEPGDHVHAIDWKASARLSAAHGNDEFIVRERHAEEMSRVVLVIDRRPSMALYPDELPWLNKPRAVEFVTDLLVASALNQRGLVGYLDLGSHANGHEAGTPFWQRPRSQLSTWQGDLRERVLDYLSGGFDAPDDGLERALAYLSTAARGSLPLGTFVFIVSDFTAPLSPGSWARALEQRWDLVPIVVQDPIWEQSFPSIQGVLTPLADPGRSTRRLVRFDAKQVEERRRANQARLDGLLTDFAGLGLDAVLIGSSNPNDVHAALLSWAEHRAEQRGRRI
ncbi:MAG TPA: DUF58 domain-containing protein [Gaiellaceae bacterium]